MFEILWFLAVVASTLGALALFVLNELTSNGNGSFAESVAMLVDPGEAIPFYYGDSLPQTPSFLGIPCQKRRQPTSKRVDIASSIHLRDRWHAYASYMWLFVKGLFMEMVLTAYRVDRRGWNRVWWKEFYLQHMFKPSGDVCSRPVRGAVTSSLNVCLRHPDTNQLTGDTINCINLASYNYLGFGGYHEKCASDCREAVEAYGLSSGRPRPESDQSILNQLESEVAKFVGKEDAIVMAMGFATNSSIISAVLSKGDTTSDTTSDTTTHATSSTSVYAISDELNHRSIIEGVRLSQETEKTFVFRHNDMTHLEEIVFGLFSKSEKVKTRNFQVWIFCEGIYSMEGEFCALAQIIKLKQTYQSPTFHLHIWLDEAHSIGAVGPTGRGVTEYLSQSDSTSGSEDRIPLTSRQSIVDNIDIMMGTFTKSFASAGGYVAGSRDLIGQIRSKAPGFLHANAMPAVCAAQVLSVMRILKTPEGLDRISRLLENSNFFRSKLRQIGGVVIGDEGSPVICLLLVNPRKTTEFSRKLLAKGVAVVVCGYPVVPMLLARARFCVSADHTIQQLQHAIDLIEEVGLEVGVLFNRNDRSTGLGNSLTDMTHEVMADQLEGVHQPLVIDKSVPVERSDTDCDTLASYEVVVASVQAHDDDGETQSVDADSEEPQSFKTTTGRAPHSLDPSVNDPLGLRAHPPSMVTDAVQAQLMKVGLGTCGPRGFYGSTLEHLEFEKDISSFLGYEAAALYATHASVTSSVVAAFIHKEDAVFLQADSGESGFRTGLMFTHKSSAKDPRSVYEWASMLQLQDLVSAKSAKNGRNWILCAGGSPMLKLREVVKIKQSVPNCLIILDDSNCIGTAGLTGRGTLEVGNVSPKDVDMLIGSLENGFGSVGGFCCSEPSIAEHQTLFSGGFCFSASSPSIFPLAGSMALEWLQSSEGIARLKKLQHNIHRFRAVVDSHVRDVCMSDSDDDEEIVQYTIMGLLSSEESYTQLIRLCPYYICSCQNELSAIGSKVHVSNDGIAKVNITADWNEDDIDCVVDGLARIAKLHHRELTYEDSHTNTQKSKHT